MMAEAATPPFVTVPNGKKANPIKKAIVMNSITSTIPIVVPEASEHLSDSPMSAPSSPEKSKGKKKGLLKKHLRPKSPIFNKGRSHSDPETSTTPSPQARPRWLGIGRHKRRKSPDTIDPGPDLNGDTPASLDPISSSTSSLEPEATLLEQLPGRTPQFTGPCLPEIRVVTIEGHESSNDGMACSEDSGIDGPYRKNSQSSRCSSGSGGLAASGISSLLSPSVSGDESYPSDLESPLSLEENSSFTEEIVSVSDPEMADTGTITSRKSPSITSLTATTPTPTGESPPAIGGGVLSSPTSDEGKEVRRKSKDKDREKQQGGKVTVWDKVRNAVKAWSPFAVQFKKKYYPWVQLAGHAGNFMPGGENGTILKKSDPRERNALRALMEDTLRNYVPEFKREVETEGHVYVEMTDLLREFNEPAVMDIKMGIRTYLEEELGKKNSLRPDMYQKMIDVDPNEPTEKEHEQKAITKTRYMQWRESLSSTSTLGFRIEGIKTTSGKALKDFKKTKEPPDVLDALRMYIEENSVVKGPFLKRLLDIRAALDTSSFFASHELIGSSLLFVYDNSGLATIHMIDFGKTTPLPPGLTITHRTEWTEGTHEDGYLYGLDNLIEIWREL